MGKTDKKNEMNPVPRHVAIIMDGNGRWATSHGLDRSQGHIKGVETVRVITEAAAKAGVDYLTLYAFSTENWNRPKQEIDSLMKLIVIAIERETPDLLKNNVRLTAIGDIERLPEATRLRLEKCIDETSVSTGIVLCLALSYSSRWDITKACREIAREVNDGSLSEEEITEEVISNHLATRDIPDPDLLIRTGGDRRISNFLLWQAAYAELYFTSVYWPDFTAEHFNEAIKEYQSRERRFGLTTEQIQQ